MPISKNQLVVVAILCLLYCFSACELINPEEDIPAFIKVDNFQLTTALNTQGSNRHQINDVWAFVGGEALGVFELPATIPVLATGTQNITLFAGIRENGLRSSPVIYPFYERYEVELNLVPEQTTTISPRIKYNTQNSIFELIEDFEDSRLSLRTTIPNALNRTTTQILEGTASGQVLLNTNPRIELTSTTTFLDLPTSEGLPVYLEMDYRTNVELEVGLVGISTDPLNPIEAVSYKVILCPLSEWNKVYINFQEDLEISQLDAYRLAFRASIEDTGCGNSNRTNPEVLLDNIKLIRFQP